MMKIEKKTGVEHVYGGDYLITRLDSGYTLVSFTTS